MKLSIIVLSYNQRTYISKALDSIINQNTDCSFEIIVGDDCSSDGTQDIICNYVKQYPLIIKPVFRKKNLGLIRNYFSLIAECKGEYIMQCAGDDYWLSNKINKQITFMDNNPNVSMVCSGYHTVDENDKWISENIKVPRTDFYSLFNGNQIAALTVCFRRDIIEKYIQAVNPLEKNWMMEDYPFWLWISQNGVISFIPEALCSYRIVKGSISHPKSLGNQIQFQSSIYNIRLNFSSNETDRKKAYDLFINNVALVIYKNKGIVKAFKYLLENRAVITFGIFVLNHFKMKYLNLF